MPSWWKRSKSTFHRSSVTPSSAPGSPARASTSRVQTGGRRGGGEGDFLAVAPPKQLTRQRKLRHVDGIDVDGLGGLAAAAEPGRRASSSPPLQRGRAAASEAVGIPGSTPISRSASSREAVVQPPRSASSPVLHPLPLPSPRPPDMEAQDQPGVADGWGLGERTAYAPRCLLDFLSSFRLLFLLTFFVRFDRHW